MNTRDQMTMPNPVAEVVERLRAIARTRCINPFVPDQPSFAAAHGLTVEKTTEWIVADLLERLSRERDTGVPEGFWLAPNEPPRDMCWAAADIVITDDLRTYKDPFQKQEVVSGKLAALVFQAMRTAAPQPPTVSTQGWPVGASSDLPDEIYVERDADTNEKRWYSCKGMGEKYVHARLLDNWKFVAKHGLAKVTPEHTWAQWLAEMKADLSALTRERDQAREAARIAHDELCAVREWAACEKAPLRPQEILSISRAIDAVARSVLHPENEEKA